MSDRRRRLTLQESRAVRLVGATFAIAAVVGIVTLIAVGLVKEDSRSNIGQPTTAREYIDSQSSGGITAIELVGSAVDIITGSSDEDYPRSTTGLELPQKRPQP